MLSGGIGAEKGGKRGNPGRVLWSQGEGPKFHNLIGKLQLDPRGVQRPMDYRARHEGIGAVQGDHGWQICSSLRLKALVLRPPP